MSFFGKNLKIKQKIEKVDKASQECIAMYSNPNEKREFQTEGPINVRFINIIYGWGNVFFNGNVKSKEDIRINVSQGKNNYILFKGNVESLRDIIINAYKPSVYIDGNVKSNLIDIRSDTAIGINGDVFANKLVLVSVPKLHSPYESQITINGVVKVKECNLGEAQKVSYNGQLINASEFISLVCTA